jgi:CHAT domain-containing protein
VCRAWQLIATILKARDNAPEEAAAREEAAKAAVKSGYPELIADTRIDRVKIDVDHLDANLEELKLLRTKSEKIVDRTGKLRCDVLIAAIYSIQGKTKEAEDAFQSADKYLRETEAQIPDPLLQISYRTDHISVLKTSIQFLDDPGKAFQLVERCKGYALLGLLTEINRGSGRKLTKEEEEETRAFDQMMASEARLLHTMRDQNAPDSEIARLEGQIEQQRHQHDQFRRRAVLDPGSQPAVYDPDPITLAQVQSRLFSANPEAIVASYMVHDDYVQVYILQSGPDKGDMADCTSLKLRVSIKELKLKAQLFELACATRGGQVRGDVARAADLVNGHVTAGGDMENLSRWLYNSLVGPWAQKMSGKRLLIISGDGFLNGLPFQALRSTAGQFLVEAIPVSYAPSVSSLVEMMARRDRLDAGSHPPIDLLALGRPNYQGTLPDLPGTQQEVEAIQPLFKAARVYVGERATETAFKAEASTARFIHLATHGLLNTQNPLYSSIALTPDAGNDGRMNAQEVFDLKLNAELVTISACETALGQVNDGEGVLGLGWMFLAAGSPSILVSQWSVNDASTSQWMKFFYQDLTNPQPKTQYSKAVSVQQAQIKMLHNPATAHPYYWAPFVLIGDPR